MALDGYASAEDLSQLIATTSALALSMGNAVLDLETDQSALQASLDGLVLGGGDEILVTPVVGVPRTLNDAFKDIVSIKVCGATGDGSTLDTVAVQAALDNYGALFVPPGEYLTGPLVFTRDVVIYGCGPASKFTFAAGTGTHVNTGNFNVQFRDVWFFGGYEGGQSAGVAPVSDRNCFALDYRTRSYGQRVRITGYGNKGVMPNNAASSVSSEFSWTGFFISGCYIGIDASKAEYTKWTNGSIVSCRTGMDIRSGNVLVDHCIITYNGDNIWVYGVGDANNGHGVVSNCLLNHALGNAILCEGLINGMTFTGNQIYYGIIRIIDCYGVNLEGGSMDVTDVIVSYGGNNYMHGVYVDNTLANAITRPNNGKLTIQDCYTQTGPWISNNYVPELGDNAYTATDKRIGIWWENGSVGTQGWEWTTSGANGELKLWPITGGTRAATPALAIEVSTGQLRAMKLVNAADDTAAAAAGVGLGCPYHTAGVPKVRVT